jgi:hypothetical protein
MQASSVGVRVDEIFRGTGTFGRRTRGWAALSALVLSALLLTAGSALAQNPVPQINEPLIPASATPGGPAFTLTVNGTGFTPASVVYCNGSPRATAFVRSTQLTAGILSTDVAAPGTASITVLNGARGVASNAAFFQVTYTSDSVSLSRTDYLAGLMPMAVATGDFNGDGKLDLAVADGFGNSVSILLGNGDGTFQNAVAYSLIGYPVAIAAADFNGDGKLDLVVVCQRRSQVSVLLGNGDGTFQAHVDYSTGLNPQAVAAGDFNQDGKLDLAVVNYHDNSVSILLGNGDGTFQAHVDHATGNAPLSVTTGDFNKDGIPDLAVVNNNDNTVSILLGNGDGTFKTHVDYATGLVPDFVAAADFNADGVLDLAVVNAVGTVSILLGNGDGSFGAHVDYSTGVNPQFAVVGDFNGDGDLDLAVANYSSNNISILLGNRAGGFAVHQDHQTGANPGWITAGDFNGDGKLDLVVPDLTANTVSVLLQPSVGVSSSLLPFGDQLVGTTSAPQTVILENSGNPAAAITSVVVTGTNGGDFAQTNTCGNSVAGGASCTISVTFAPSANGAESASLSIAYNAAGSPQTVNLTGTGVAPAVALSTTSLTFANQNVGTASTAQGVTLTNSGTGPLTLSSIAVTGTNTKDFGQTNSCGAGIGPGTTCTINVTFSPTATGARSASVTVTDSAAGSPQGITVAGTGMAPVTSFSPINVSFASQPIGATSTPQTITLTNVGSADLTISSLTITGTNSGDFAQTNNCGTGVAAGASCTVSVTFTPRINGAESASLSMADNAAGSPQTVSLTGTGVAPVVSLAPSSVPFGNQLVGTTSTPQSVTLQNSGTAPLTITSMVTTGTNSGDFAQTNTCGNGVAAGASCTISVTFAPTINGAESASFSMVDNAAGSPQAINLTGTGVAPAVTLSTTSLTFTNQNVGTNSAAQGLTLTNSGTGALTLTSIAITGPNSGDFVQTSTCGASIGPGTSCTINVTFSPSATGTRSASVIVTDSAVGSPQTVSATGTGIAPGVSLAPVSIPFGNQLLGTTSTPQSVTLQDSGSAPLTIASIAITGGNSGDFVQTNTCGSSVAAGASCTISVVFTPSVNGAESASLSIADNAASSPQSVTLAGTGVAPTVTLLTTSLTFANQDAGTTSTAQPVMLTNSGTGPLTLTSIAITGTNSGDFAQTNTCGNGVAAGASCTISVTFTPSINGVESASLSIVDNAAGSPQTVALTGTGVAPVVSLSAASVPFGNQLVGTTSTPQSVTLQNSGSAPLTITSILITGTNSGDFAQTNTCGSILLPGAGCSISVTFAPSPSVAGSEAAFVALTDSALGSPQMVSLSGTGIAAVVTPASLSFPNQTIATSSGAQVATFQNTGTTAISVSSITITGTNPGDFTETDTCATGLAAGSSCAISVTFTPTGGGPRSAAMTVAVNAAGTPQTVSLSGAGADPIGTATGTQITCAANVPPGTTCYTLTISCPDVAPMTAGLKVTTPTVPSIGTIVFGTGGGGFGYYDQLFRFGSTTVTTVVQAGFTAAQISFNGLPVGWLTGPGGVRKLACRYASAAQWIYNNVHQANTAAPFCATGNSAGSAAIAYALAHYGLDPIFSMVELTSGPPMARIDYGCICSQPAQPTPCGTTLLGECYGGEGAVYLDPAYGSPICSQAEKTHDTTNQLLFLNDSVASPDALFAYPKTDVHAVYGGKDLTAAVPLGNEYIMLITTKKEVSCVADAPHALPNVLDGAQQVASDLINACHLQ